MPGGSELATAYVRIRPDVSGFGSEASAKIKGSLSETTAEINRNAKANIAATEREIDANAALARSYAAIARAAPKGSDRQIVASQLAARAHSQVAVVLGESTARTRTGASDLEKFGGSARGAEKDVDRFSRGILAGSGLVDHFGRTLAFASGGFLAFAGLTSTIHDALAGAGAIAKSSETIRSSFDGASKSVLHFDETAGKLGLSAASAESASAQFGILFKNLGIGQHAAATMTIGFEKLAASLAAVRGIDPSQAINETISAALGSERALRALGISVDQTQIKVAALKLGIIQSINQALTPAQRAEAIYALTTANAGFWAQKAAQHTNDFANVQRHLAAEFSNARDALGTALLPIFNKYATSIADWLQKAEKSGRLQADFTKGAQDIAKAVTAVVKIVSLSIDGWQKFGHAVGGAGNAFKILLAAFAAWKGGQLISGLLDSGKAVKILVSNFGLLQKGSKVARDEIIANNAEVEASTVATAEGMKAALISTGWGAIAVAAGFAAEYIITHWSKVKDWFSTFASYMEKTMAAAWAAIQKGAEFAAYGIYEYFTFAIDKLLLVAEKVEGPISSALSKIGIHIGDPFKTARQAIEGIGTDLKKMAESHSITDAWNTAGHNSADAYLKGFNDEIRTTHGIGGGAPSVAKGKDFPSLSDAVDSLVGDLAQQALDAQKIKDAYDKVMKANQSGIDNLKSQIKTLHSSLKDAITQESTDVANAVVSAKQNLTQLGQTLASDINSTLEAPLNKLQDQLSLFQSKQSLEDIRRQVLLPGGKQLSTDPKVALAQLKHLAAASSTVSKAAIQDFIVQYQQAVLQVQQSQVKLKENTLDKRVNDLTDALERGKISGPSFTKKLKELLKGADVSYKSAGQYLGTAFRNGFEDTIHGILAQAKALAAVPNRAGFTDPSTKIVKPLDVLHNDQRKIENIQAQIRDKHGALLTRIARASEKAAQAAAKQADLARREAATKVNTNTPGSPAYDAAHKNVRTK